MLRKDGDVGNVPRSARTQQFLSRPGVFGLQKRSVVLAGDREMPEEHEPRPPAPTNGRKGGRCKWPSRSAKRQDRHGLGWCSGDVGGDTLIEILKVLSSAPNERYTHTVGTYMSFPSSMRASSSADIENWSCEVVWTNGEEGRNGKLGTTKEQLKKPRLGNRRFTSYSNATQLLPLANIVIGRHQV